MKKYILVIAIFFSAALKANTYKILIQGSGFAANEFFVGLTGYGTSLLGKRDTGAFKPFNKKQDPSPESQTDNKTTLMYNPENWSTYNRYCYPVTLNRQIFQKHAQDILSTIPKDCKNLEIVGLSHGGTIGLLITEAIRNRNDETVKSKERNPSKIKLTTIGTPVSPENNEIVRSNISDTNTEIIHYHYWSEADLIAKIDVIGLASHSFGGMKLQFSNFNNPAKFRQICLHKNNKMLGHLDESMIGTNEQNIERQNQFVEMFSCEQQDLTLNLASSTVEESTKQSDIKFSDSIFLRKRIVTPVVGTVIIGSTLIYLRRKIRKKCSKIKRYLKKVAVPLGIKRTQPK